MANTSSYSYTFNNFVKYVDKNGEIPIIPWLLKAGAGAAADMLAQASMDYLFNSTTTSWSQAFDNVNWYQVGRSGVEGLIPWKTQGGKLGRAAGTAAGDVLVNAINNPSGYTAEQAGIDFATGFVGDLAGGGMGELLSKYGAKQVASGLVRKLGWASKAAHSITGVWHSGTDGNFAGAVANKLGDVVEDVDVNFEFSGGKGDIDIVTKTFNIEVKSGKSPNLSQSLKNLEYSKNQGKGYILYMPKANRAQIYDAAKRGVTLLRTEAELKQATGGN
ncbi:hypothetical protein [Emticicia sp. TH156]|uniref:hypothetical protein n=1 Tax=Emticicia sp. TH156 TaxID=2067454 RepID=UPI000CB84EF4|nr:hypothetical protein [Emticicia sp. TH156]PLK43913.1 hypothetical protein C0V77_12225 [Emticicia sp. TH156]